MSDQERGYIPTADDVARIEAMIDARGPAKPRIIKVEPPTNGYGFGYSPPPPETWIDGDAEALRAKRNGVDFTRPATPSHVLLDGHAIAKPLPDLEYLVRDLGLVAGSGAPHLLAGGGFSGKTLAVQSMLVSLASGHPVWGAYTAAPRRVIHVDLEQGHRLTCRRYQRLALAMGVDLRELGDALSLAVMPPYKLTAAHRLWWRDVMAGRDLLVVDSLRAASAGADENSSEIRASQDLLGGLSEDTSCRAYMIHHSRKPSKDSEGGRFAIRGSSAIFDAADAVHVFEAAKGEPVAVEHVKARSHGELLPDFALVISDEDVAGEPRAGLRVRVHGAELVAERREKSETESREGRTRHDAGRVRKAIAKAPSIGTRELRGVTGLSGDRLAAALSHLGASVRVESGPGRGQHHFLVGGES